MCMRDREMINLEGLEPDMSHLNGHDHYKHIYEPAEDTWLLVDTLASEGESRFLCTQFLCEGRPLTCMEIGSGSGYVITYLHHLLARLAEESNLDSDSDSDSCTSRDRKRQRQRHIFLASDINERAVQATAMTLEKNGVACWDIVRMNLADGFLKRLCANEDDKANANAEDRGLDILIFNPPYVPTPEKELGRDDIYASWAGGERGRQVTDKLLPQVQHLLNPYGVFYLIALEDNDPQEIMELMSSRDYGGFKSRIISGHKKGGEDLSVIKFWRGLRGASQ